MTCGCHDSDSLVLGDQLGELTVWVVPGEPRTWSLFLSEWDEETQTFGDVIAWPAEPVLVLGDDLEITATLSAYTPAGSGPVADALATWTVTGEQTEPLTDFAPARLKLEDATVWSGAVRCQS